jgi:DMSO/TMAO reductase YedYZ molybdopterin-dependent catalytic subunit
MEGNELRDTQSEALWRKAERAGMSRRRFLALLGASGAAAVLTSCTRAPVTTTTTTTETKTVTATPPPATTTTTAAGPLIWKPIPPQYFVPLGSNAEMRFEVMRDRTYQMPNSFFFVRGHTFTPQPIDVTKWTLTLEGDGISNPMTLTYDDLLKLPATTFTRYVECAGNGRSFFDSLMKQPAQGGQWHLGAYGIADWVGVKLGEILDRAGIKSSAVDVMPQGFDSARVARPMSVARAMEQDTLIAYMMNGEILPPDHGFPARALTPGWVGIANIKWLDKITVSTTPLYTDKNTTSYVFIGPDYQPAPPALGPVLSTQVMKSACCLPWPATLRPGPQTIVGYAWSPFGKITSVDVSLDGGSNFQPAVLTGPNIERAGTRWEFGANLVPGTLTITPRAKDSAGNEQYPVSQQKWNQQGYLFGAMVPHPVTVTA